MRRMTNSNRQGWDRLAETHFKTYHIDRLLAGTPLLDPLIREEVGDVRGKSLVHLLCHIGTDTLSWALLGAQVTGIDISPKSLEYARLLAEKMDLRADFIEADILDVQERVDRKFDIVFSSTGVLCWQPDMALYARTVRALLNPGGFFYIHEGHPFRNMLYDDLGKLSQNQVQSDYFRKETWHYEAMGDYTDPDLKVPHDSYEWNWTIGQVVTAFCEAGLRVVFLHEFPRFFYGGYTPYELSEGNVELYPCTFSLKAVLY
jgi:SAM-dependent methyltransferase